MTEFQNKSFSVHAGVGKEYRDNHDRIFGPRTTGALPACDCGGDVTEGPDVHHHSCAMFRRAEYCPWCHGVLVDGKCSDADCPRRATPDDQTGMQNPGRCPGEMLTPRGDRRCARAMGHHEEFHQSEDGYEWRSEKVLREDDAQRNRLQYYQDLWEQSCRGVAELCDLIGVPEGAAKDLWTLKACIDELRCAIKPGGAALRFERSRMLPELFPGGHDPDEPLGTWQCQERESRGNRCELKAGHKGKHECPMALAAWEKFRKAGYVKQ